MDYHLGYASVPILKGEGSRYMKEWYQSYRLTLRPFESTNVEEEKFLLFYEVAIL